MLCVERFNTKPIVRRVRFKIVYMDMCNAYTGIKSESMYEYTPLA